MSVIPKLFQTQRRHRDLSGPSLTASLLAAHVPTAKMAFLLGEIQDKPLRVWIILSETKSILVQPCGIHLLQDSPPRKLQL